MYRVCVLYSCDFQKTLGHGTLRLWSRQPVQVRAKILPSRKRWKPRPHMFRPHACSEDAEILFHFWKRDHLGRKSTDDLFNIGDPGREKDRRVGDGLDVAFRNWQRSARVITTISRISLSCSSVWRPPIPSRSGAEPSGEPKFEDVAGNGDTGTGLSDAWSRRAMKAGGNQQNWVVDTWTRQNQKSS